MTYSQVEKAIPLYNQVHELKFQLESLSLLRISLEETSSLSIAFRANNGLDVTIDNLEGSFGLDLVSSLVHHKREKLKLVESKLSLIT